MTHILLVAALVLVVEQCAMLATTIYLHRSLAHRSVRLAAPARLACRCIVWMTSGISPREWVAVHRMHHVFADTPADPHSPVVLGFWRVQLGNVWLYRDAARRAGAVERYAGDIRRDRLDAALFDIGWLGPIVLAGLLAPVVGVIAAVVTVILTGVLYVASSASINAAGHLYGYRSFPSPGTNGRILALLTAGEGLHNNHHERPRSPRFATTASECDLGWYAIRGLARVRLAAIVKDPSHARPATLGDDEPDTVGRVTAP